MIENILYVTLTENKSYRYNGDVCNLLLCKTHYLSNTVKLGHSQTDEQLPRDITNPKHDANLATKSKDRDTLTYLQQCRVFFSKKKAMTLETLLLCSTPTELRDLLVRV